MTTLLHGLVYLFAIIGFGCVLAAFVGGGKRDDDDIHALCRAEIERLTAELAMQYRLQAERTAFLVGQVGDGWQDQGIGVPDFRCAMPDCERRVWRAARGGRES